MGFGKLFKFKDLKVIDFLTNFFKVLLKGGILMAPFRL